MSMTSIDDVVTAHGRAQEFLDDAGERRVRFCGGQTSGEAKSNADPIASEVIRHALNTAAEQMSMALCRTSVSATIYDMLDFAVALFDRDVRMLAQAPCLPIFMGNLSFLVDSAVAAIGGEDQLHPGDIIMYNIPYGVGGHAQDIGMVMPIFTSEGELVGYSALRAHVMDIAAKAPYCTDTIDVFQEGVLFPGVKVYEKGVKNDSLWRMLFANTRFPRSVAGDTHAMVVCARSGASSLIEIIDRFGRDTFFECVARIYDHGESVIRDYFGKLPDGTYIGEGALDSDGVNDEIIPFHVKVTIADTSIEVDFTDCPDQLGGPLNSLFPTTVSATRVAIAMLAGSSESPNEGFYRPITVISRPGSMFHPLPPAPSFLTDWPGGQAMEAIYHAISAAMPEAVPACSGGDPNVSILWGENQLDGTEPWAEAATLGVGQGGDVVGDGASSLHHVSCSSMRLVSAEIWEACNPWLVERRALRVDSCGPGRAQGGLGQEVWIRLLEKGFITAVSERARTAPWGLVGGGEAVPNGRIIEKPGESPMHIEKVTGMPLPAGTLVKLLGGGGGGYGDPREREPSAVLNDVREGHITEEFAKRNYPHVVIPERRSATG
jgi:N-methylhydantoinase B